MAGSVIKRLFELMLQKKRVSHLANPFVIISDNNSLLLETHFLPGLDATEIRAGDIICKWLPLFRLNAVIIGTAISYCILRLSTNFDTTISIPLLISPFSTTTEPWVPDFS